mmetsp:Transcript_67175/g.116936  ORF Transcript_67175/g.116936 Transcript_67175/m.116936 type:complete len:218 (+) Transcript_67175:644-1297(+)
MLVANGNVDMRGGIGNSFGRAGAAPGAPVAKLVFWAASCGGLLNRGAAGVLLCDSCGGIASEGGGGGPGSSEGGAGPPGGGGGASSLAAFSRALRRRRELNEAQGAVSAAPLPCALALFVALADLRRFRLRLQLRPLSGEGGGGGSAALEVAPPTCAPGKSSGGGGGAKFPLAARMEFCMALAPLDSSGTDSAPLIRSSRAEHNSPSAPPGGGGGGS